MIRQLSKSLLTIATLVLLGNVVCEAQAPLRTRHVRDEILTGRARSAGRLPATQPMRIVLTLPHRNEDELQQLLRDLYDPSSPLHHRFLTVEQFTERFGPSQEDYDTVIRFAEAHGLAVVGTSRNRMNLDVQGTVETIERALHVNMGLYRHPAEPRNFYSPDREPTPDLAVPLSHIAGLDNYSIPRPAIARRQGLAQPQVIGGGSCPGQSFCGSDMRTAYYGGGPLTGSGQSVGLLEYFAGADLTDLNTYFANIGQTNTVPITFVSADGTSTSCLIQNGCDDTEQTLDMTQAISMAPGLASLVMYVGTIPASLLNAMATAHPLNAQLSSSWIWNPTDTSAENAYFEEFAAQGQNLFQASGDSAAWTTNSGIFPAEDAFVTSVGGTDLVTSGPGGPWSSETAWSESGGGSSPHHYAIPSWQVSAANQCFSCSKTYRNGPDVSANANYTFYVCADQSCTSNVYGGTSFAAPMWAGYLALANQQAVANGGTTLGFINPTLYSTGTGPNYHANFHDITSGSNGWNAAIGFDLVTGWGSPNGATLINTLLGNSSPPPPPSLTPTLSSISPSSGAPGANVPVTLIGTNFVSPLTINISGTGVTPSGVTINSSTQATATFQIASGATLGGRSVTVKTNNGTSGTVTFTVAQPTPTLTSISPSSASLNSSTSVTLTGTNLATPATINISGSGVTATGATVASSTQITATFNVASSATTGSHNVSVSTPNGTTGTVIFSVNGSSGASPSLTSISPASGKAGTTVKVTLAGKNLTGLSAIPIQITGGGITVSSVAPVGTAGTGLTATFTIGSTATKSTRFVSVKNASGAASNTVSFTVQ
ncbi:MAG TPA: protease pro-enzyme activation domain-containing protein [Bryobacteraceae bacterium]|nr:protease pro-enzyme activation domain-containing protein [Bryobacteraceae bacterium]